MSTRGAVIVDYGVGNIRSLMRAIENSSDITGFETKVSLTKDIEDIKNSDLLILPGVGSWGAASKQLKSWSEELSQIIKTGKPTFAVCLGMQLLFESSEEGQGEGLGVFQGKVSSLKATQSPHMGWNTITQTQSQYPSTRWAYFAHSYAVRPEDESIIAGTTQYEDDSFPSIIRTPTLLATQFHPEKSDVAGIALVQNYVKEVLS